MIRVRQKFDSNKIDSVYTAVCRQFARSEIKGRIHQDDRVAVGCGSRGIRDIDKIVKTAIDCLLELGANPFIVPAMGSHGGATPEGQRQVLASYGCILQAPNPQNCKEKSPPPPGEI